jgi:hypothetical protein
MVLAFDAGMLDEVPGICLQAGHSTANVLIDFDNLFDRRGFEKSGCNTLLNAQDNTLVGCYLIWSQNSVFGLESVVDNRQEPQIWHPGFQTGAFVRNRKHTPIAVEPSLIASREYSTWNKRPSGEKVLQ